MINLIFGNKEKLIPKTWEEITIGQYQKLAKVELDNSIETLMELVNIFTDIPISTIEEMEYGEFGKLSTLVSNVLLSLKNRVPKTVKHFKYKSNKYELVKNFYKITTNELMQLDHLMKQDVIDNIHRIIPVLYKNRKHKISEEGAKELSCEIALSALDFIIAHVQK